MNVIYKYVLRLIDTQKVAIPSKALVLSVQEQRGEICLWALVETEDPKVVWTVDIYGTGTPIEKDGTYLGTVQMETFVWHIFKRV